MKHPDDDGWQTHDEQEGFDMTQRPDICELLVSGVSEAEADHITRFVSNYRAMLEALRGLLDAEALRDDSRVYLGAWAAAKTKARAVLSTIDKG